MENATTVFANYAHILLALAFALAVCLAFALGVLFQKVRTLRAIKDARQDALKKSRATLGGQAAEQLAPFLPNFPCNPADVRFVGKPVDFVGFPGAAEGKAICEVLIIEVKSGTSRLSERERQIKAAVESGRVRYVEYRV